MEFSQLSPEVQELLREVAEEEGFQQTQFTVSPGSKTGDNHIGIVHRVVLNESQDGCHRPSLSLIVKRPPDNLARRTWLYSLHLFANEAAFYNHIIPAFLNFQKQKGITSHVLLNFQNPSPPHPRCLRAGQQIVMEDQLPLGFVMRERKEPLDYAHCMLVMSELGRLHAVSFALRDQRPTLFQGLSPWIQEILLTKDRSKMNRCFLNAFHKAIDKFVERSQVTNKSKYLEALKKMEVDHYEKILELVSPTNAEPYSVINHGDCWTNNVLFKYRKGCKEPDSLCLLDFQMARLASPACDLTYFLFCCTDKSTRDANYLDMLEGYHSSLATHLANLGSNVDTLFPMEALQMLFLVVGYVGYATRELPVPEENVCKQDQLRRYGRFGMLMAMGLLPMFTCNSDEMPDLDDACKDDSESFDQTFDFDHSNDKECWDRVCGIIVDAVDYGYMD